MMWKVICESVEGTSHAATGIPCQDSSIATPFKYPHDQGMILICSDGAGTASQAEVGSRIACQSASNAVISYLETGRTVADIDDGCLLEWARAVNQRLVDEAESRSIPPRELACTLVLAVIGNEAAAFAQIGDGVIVIHDQGQYRTVFWPQSGEYLNTTFFVTDSKFTEYVQRTIIAGSFSQVALLTDGLQGLALSLAEKTVHQPFFAPMFQSLGSSEDAAELIVPVREFLGSPAVNSRTDDDKTLVMATKQGGLTE